jgi:hypothetical protein
MVASARIGLGGQHARSALALERNLGAGHGVALRISYGSLQCGKFFGLMILSLKSARSEKDNHQPGADGDCRFSGFPSPRTKAAHGTSRIIEANPKKMAAQSPNPLQ